MIGKALAMRFRLSGQAIIFLDRNDNHGGFASARHVLRTTGQRRVYNRTEPVFCVLKRQHVTLQLSRLKARYTDSFHLSTFETVVGPESCVVGIPLFDLVAIRVAIRVAIASFASVIAALYGFSL